MITPHTCFNSFDIYASLLYRQFQLKSCSKTQKKNKNSNLLISILVIGVAKLTENNMRFTFSQTKFWSDFYKTLVSAHIYHSRTQYTVYLQIVKTI